VAVEWTLADVRDLVPDERAYDLVAVIYLHLPADERRLVLARAAAAVAPGGTLIVVGHDRTNLTEGVGGPRVPTVLFTPDDGAGELPGLRVERAERVHRETAEGTAIDALVRARRPAS
jgi:hypothetical protein